LLRGFGLASFWAHGASFPNLRGNHGLAEDSAAKLGLEGGRSDEIDTMAMYLAASRSRSTGGARVGMGKTGAEVDIEPWRVPSAASGLGRSWRPHRVFLKSTLPPASRRRARDRAFCHFFQLFRRSSSSDGQRQTLS
jgi:hypothetical protein